MAPLQHILVHGLVCCTLVNWTETQSSASHEFLLLDECGDRQQGEEKTSHQDDTNHPSQMDEHGGPAGEAEQQEGRIHFPLVTYAEKAYHRHVHGLLNKTTMINRIMTSALNQGAATGSTHTRTPMKSPPHSWCPLPPTPLLTPATSPPHSRCSLHSTHQACQCC